MDEKKREKKIEISNDYLMGGQAKNKMVGQRKSVKLQRSRDSNRFDFSFWLCHHPPYILLAGITLSIDFP